MKYYAHRGLYTADQQVPENTMAAFSKAMDAGYGSELDVQLSKDGVAYVFHDSNLKRMIGIDALVRDMSSAQLDDVRINGHCIPRFSAVLKLIAGQVPLIVELKSGPDIGGLCQEVARLLLDYQGAYWVESFDPRIVYWFKKNQPQMKRGQLLMQRQKYDNGFLGFFLSSLLCNVLTRPHFNALEKNMGTSRLGQRYYRRFSPIMVGWTLHEHDRHVLGYHAVIFEFYLPEPSQ